MHRALILVMLTAAILVVTTLVAASAGTFFWGGMMGLTSADRATSGLMAAVYAPFALLAMLLPVLSVPMARFALRFGGSASAITAVALPFWLAWVLLFVAAEALTAVVRAATGEGAFTEPLFVHLLLAGYAAAAACLLRRSPDHARAPSTDSP